MAKAHMAFGQVSQKSDCKKVKYHMSDSKHLTVIPAFVWTNMIIDKHRECIHIYKPFKKAMNKQ
jgi:hypothetical protein